MGVVGVATDGPVMRMAAPLLLWNVTRSMMTRELSVLLLPITSGMHVGTWVYKRAGLYGVDTRVRIYIIYMHSDPPADCVRPQ